MSTRNIELRRVVSARKEKDPDRWVCRLDCGHVEWRSNKNKPTSIHCYECGLRARGLEPKEEP